MNSLSSLGFSSPESLFTPPLSLADVRTAHENHGKPAIKAFNTFVSKGNGGGDKSRVAAAAERTAQQVDFLSRRHRAAISTTLRNTDGLLPSNASENKDDFASVSHPLCLVLDNLRSAENVGSILRSCDACGVNFVVPIGITASPHSLGREKVLKASLGSEEFIRMDRRFESLQEGLRWLRGEGWRVVAMETMEGAKSIYDFENLQRVDCSEFRKTAIVVGNEVTGIDEEILQSDLVDDVLEIPMFGRKNSLNVSVATGIALSEIVRQINNKSST